MELAAARARLERMVQAKVAPALEEHELEELLELAARTDLSGLAPTAPGWTPTYNLAAAAAEGWRWKAGKAADESFTVVDGATFDRRSVHTACLKMAASYDAAAASAYDPDAEAPAASSGIGAVPLLSPTARDLDLDSIVVNAPAPEPSP